MLRLVVYALLGLTGNYLGSYAMMPDVPQSCTFPDVPGAEKHVLGQRAVAWTCKRANATWSTGELVLLRSCGDNLSALPSCVPSPPTSGGIKPCTDAPPVPTNAVLKYQFGRNGSYGRYYECKKESGWVFGTTGRLTQCLMGKWTPIYDMCDEGLVRLRGRGIEAAGLSLGVEQRGQGPPHVRFLGGDVKPQESSSLRTCM
ncbi:hypothetical protein C7M84_015485 [Penaeus vannamei]|uniref:Sushi domain-containing protein n=1 Tax=Penaeus vannamei TaxID=6689 RepID=A0A423SQH7_PENVA|nr:hypothetical protein C7M84_015485 [Penaeus vannamei]